VNNKELLDLLDKLNACSSAIEWIKKEKLNLKQAWWRCEKADWLIWFAAKTDMVSHQKIVLVACACAETTLKYVPKGEDRSKNAIKAARNWALNPTEENRAAAADAAYAAAHAAADAAAHAAAYAAAHAADAADAAAYAAAHAADAADAAAYAAAQKKLCRIVRKAIKMRRDK